MNARHGIRAAWLALLILVFLPLSARGQAVDSAQVARTAFREAARLLRGADTAGALAQLRRAAHAWPGQGAYRLALARLAARAGRSDEAVAQFDSAAAMGFVAATADPALDQLPADQRAALAARLGRARAPLGRSRQVLSLADSLLHPEGLAFDPRTGSWYLSSIRQRKVVVVEPGQPPRDLVATAAEGLDATFGLAVDTVRNLLWVAASAVPNQVGYEASADGRARLLAFDLRTGARRVTAEAPPVSDGHLFGDLLLAPDGTVYVSDSRHPAVYRLRSGSSALEVVAQGDPLMRSLQGLALDADGRRLYVADWSHGLLLIDLETGQVSLVEPPPEASLVGIDGLLRAPDGALIGVQNGAEPARVVRLSLSGDGRRVTSLVVLDRDPAVASEPTIGVLAPGGYVYVANSPWSGYDAEGRPITDPAWRPPVLLEVPLRAQ